MRLPDTNVLLYAINAGAPQHPLAVRWLRDSFSSAEGVAFAWMAVIGFVRLSTRPGIFAKPLPVESALAVVNQWLTHPSAQVVHPSPRHAALLGGLLLGAGTAGNLTNDAHLAALAIEHQAELHTTDADFRRFPGLRWSNPLVS